MVEKPMFEWLKRKSRGISLSLNSLVMMAVGMMLVGLLFPIGLDAIESYTPTDATLVIVWPLLGVFAVLAVAITYIRSAVD